MNKNQFIEKVNSLLITYFGIPPRNKTLPDPVDMLIATILSQNTNDNNSYKAFKKLKEKYPTWEEAAKANRSSIESVIKIAGLGKQKSAAIKGFLTEILETKKNISLNYLLKLDETEAINNLTSYNGVGVKTASCVLLFAMGRNICPVDTHVHRTVNRLGIVAAKTPDKTFHLLNKNLNNGFCHVSCFARPVTKGLSK